MKQLIHQVIITKFLCFFSFGCGETVNYDVTEKPRLSGINTDNSGDSANAESRANSEVGNNPPHDVIALCESLPLETLKRELSFAELSAGQTCSFGVGDNLSRKNAYFRAYERQTQTVSIPENTMLCNFALSHKSESMRYDDEMFLLLNETIILATKDYSEYFEENGLFQTFSWPHIRDQFYDPFDPRPVYCPGGSEGLSECHVPPTETNGQIALEFSDEMNRALARKLEAERTFDFSWITTGDNDNSDCRHSAISFDLEIQYITLDD